MMKYSLLFLFCFTSITFVKAQKLDPVKWTYTVEQTKSDEATLVFKAKMDPEWHIYSQYTPDGGPLPMVFHFTAASCYERIDSVAEPKAHEDFDSTFNVKVLTFDHEVIFRQRVKLKGGGCKITGNIEYQACKDACIFLQKDFSFTTGRK